MADQDKAKRPDEEGGGKNKRDVKSGKSAPPPGWAAGLRELYDSVVEEPLPKSFEELLSKLDDQD
ncbi:NepR family anti-sigma factor [Tsuneonella mangrovi]|uniref:NepR family anti-sigma factor n=1 Tax=Tsuneonella mangrovi TaxID=1982042 RepID=UPI000BA1C66B|nr:NepR family anti-sigma factor [Tsuneonella mangrovi]